MQQRSCLVGAYNEYCGRMKRQSLPKLAESFQNKIDRLEETFKTACLSLGEPLSYAQLILLSQSRRPFPSKAEEFRIKTEMLSDQLNLLKRGQCFSQRMGALLAEREEMFRFLRNELIINRKARELNLRACCEKLEGIRLYTLTALENLQSLANRTKVHPSEYTTSILQRLVQSTDFLRFTALRKHIQFSNGDDPLFLVPLRKFQNLELTGDYHKRSIISLFNLSEAYQLRLHLADRFLRGADASQQLTPDMKSLQLKAARRANDFEYDQIVYDEAARKGRSRPNKSTSTIQKIMLPGLPTKKKGPQLEQDEDIGNKIRRLVNHSKPIERDQGGPQRMYPYRGKRAATQADQYEKTEKPITHSEVEVASNNDRPRRRMKTLDLSQGQEGDNEQTPFPRAAFKNVLIPPRAQTTTTINQTQSQIQQKPPANVHQSKFKRSAVNIQPSMSLGHHEQSSKLPTKREKYQSLTREVEQPANGPNRVAKHNQQLINRIQSKRRKRSNVKIIIEQPHREAVHVEEEQRREEVLDSQNSSLKWFREHRESRRLDFSPQVNEKISRLEQMARQSQKYLINGNSNIQKNEQPQTTPSKDEESRRYRNPIDKINEIKKEKNHPVIDAARGIKSNINTFKGGKEEIVSEQIDIDYEQPYRQPQYDYRHSSKIQRNEGNKNTSKANPSNNRAPQNPSKNSQRNADQSGPPNNPSVPAGNANKKGQPQERKAASPQNNASMMVNNQVRKPQAQRLSQVIRNQIINPNLSGTKGSPNPSVNKSLNDQATKKNQPQIKQVHQNNVQCQYPSRTSMLNPSQNNTVPIKIEDKKEVNSAPNQAQIVNSNKTPTDNKNVGQNNPKSVPVPEQSSLPSNNKLVYPQAGKSNIFYPHNNYQNSYQAKPSQPSPPYKQQPKYAPVQQLVFQAVTKPSAQDQKNASQNPNQNMSDYLNSNNNNVLASEYRPAGNTQSAIPQPERQTDSAMKRAQLMQKCIFVSKSMEQSIMFTQLKQFNKDAWRYLQPYLTTSYFKNRHLMMTTCIFKDQMASYCLHYPYVTKHGRFVFILNLEVNQQFSRVEPQLVSTFIKYIFANDPTTKVIFLKHKQLFHEYFDSVLQAQPNYAGDIKTPIKGGQLSDNSILFERKELKCTKNLEYTNVMSCFLLYITPSNSLQLSNPKFKDVYFSSNFLKRVQSALRKQEAKKFLNYRQVASYLQQERLPEFTKCKSESEMLLFSQFFEDCLINVRYFVFSKYFYFTVEPPYSYLFEDENVYYVLLSTSVDRKYFILADKIYEETENIDLYQSFRANVLNKKITDISKEDKRGAIVSCPQFQKTVQIEFSGTGTGILSFGLNWKEYIKGVRYFPQQQVKVEMIGPFFCGLVEVDEQGQIMQVFSALIMEDDLIK